ncbi:MAG TPA: aspartyl protease family protein [Steroidobacteraceae bacterium]|jgi:predicted aspartyl protease|nr:aspartyl protease family protein [Steroidobacteraceae bacterium]
MRGAFKQLAGFFLTAALATLAPAAAADAETHPMPATEVAQPEPSPNASVLALPTTHDHIGRVLVPVLINGQGPFRFIVDTGANHSTISPRLVRLLGLTPVATASVVVDGITGSAQTSFVEVKQMQTGALDFGTTLLPVVGATVMADADGILGAAGLSDQSLLIDFLRNRVEVAHRVDYLSRSQSIRVHATRQGQGLIALDVSIGRIPVRAILDTGSERSLGNLALRRALGDLRRPGGVVRLTSIYGATERVETGEIRVAPSIVVDAPTPVRINDVSIIYGDFHIFTVWGLEDRPAMVLGMDVLGTMASLSIDFKNQDVFLTSSTSVTRPLERGAAGGGADTSQKH